MAICVIAVVGVAPCQCFSPRANQTTSPGRISSIGPPSRCAHPQPELTINVCPSGCVCHAVREPGSKVTLAPCTKAGSGAWKSGSIRTVPVNQSAGPLTAACEPTLLISIPIPRLRVCLAASYTLQPFGYECHQARFVADVMAVAASSSRAARPWHGNLLPLDPEQDRGRIPSPG